MTNLQKEFQEIQLALRSFLSHPVEGMKRIPQWEWRRVILAQILITVLSGALSGLIHRSIGAIIWNVIQTPILTLITTFISSLFFYYTFQIFNERIIDFKTLFTTVLFANIPFFIFQIISGFFPPILLIGLAFTALLLIVGFVENFQIPRVFITRLIAGLYVVFVATYGLAWWSMSKSNDSWHSRSEEAPEVKLGQ
jgi:Na+/pantothenate symporter